MLYELAGVRPQIDPDAWVADTATVIGDVHVGPGSTVWFGVVLRGDTNRIRIGARSNVQDLTLVHVNPGEAWSCSIGDDVTIGHSCIIHACTLQDGAFVGMGATVLDGAVVETGGMLAAGALLAPGKRVPSGQLWAGAPARKLRDISPEDRARFDATTASYVVRGAEYRRGLVPLR